MTSSNLFEVCKDLSPDDAMSLSSTSIAIRQEIDMNILAKQFCSRQWPDTITNKSYNSVRDVDWCSRYQILSRNGVPTLKPIDSNWIDKYCFSCSMMTLDGVLVASSTNVQVAELSRAWSNGVPVTFTVTWDTNASIPCVEHRYNEENEEIQEQVEHFQYVVYGCDKSTQKWAHVVSFMDCMDDEAQNQGYNDDPRLGLSMSTTYAGVGKLRKRDSSNQGSNFSPYSHPHWMGFLNQKEPQGGHEDQLRVHLTHTGTLELGPDPELPSTYAVQHRFVLTGCTSNTSAKVFKEESISKSRLSFLQALSATLSIPESDIVDLQMNDHGRGCFIVYSISVTSNEEMIQMQEKMSQIFQVIQNFNDELKKAMVANAVESEMVETISVDTTGSPQLHVTYPDEWIERQNKWKLEKTTFELSRKGAKHPEEHDWEAESIYWKAPMTMVGLRSVLKCLEWV